MSQEANERVEAIEQVKQDLEKIQDIAQQDVTLLGNPPSSDEVTHHSEFSEFYAGPLPHPGFLGAYEDILPGSADRILAMVEKQADHRMAVEKQWIESEDQIRKQGSKFGLVVALTGMLGSICLGVVGNTGASVVMSGGTLVGLVTVFVTGKNDKDTSP